MHIRPYYFFTQKSISQGFHHKRFIFQLSSLAPLIQLKYLGIVCNTLFIGIYMCVSTIKGKKSKSLVWDCWKKDHEKGKLFFLSTCSDYRLAYSVVQPSPFSIILHSSLSLLVFLFSLLSPLILFHYIKLQFVERGSCHNDSCLSRKTSSSDALISLSALPSAKNCKMSKNKRMRPGVLYWYWMFMNLRVILISVVYFDSTRRRYVYR